MKIKMKIVIFAELSNVISKVHWNGKVNKENKRMRLAFKQDRNEEEKAG